MKKNQTHYITFYSYNLPMKKTISLFILLFSVPVFANTNIPISISDSNTLISSLRPATYTAKTQQCKTDKNLVKAIAIDYYNAEFGKVEKWKTDIEKTRTLTKEEKEDYDYVKTVFLLERNYPKSPTWRACDTAMETFKQNIDIQKSEFISKRTNLLNEYKTANVLATTTGMQYFTSPSLNQEVAVVSSKDLKKYQNELIKYEYIIKVGSANSLTLMMRNNVVNNNMADFYGNPIGSVPVLSLQKVYSAYTKEANEIKEILWNTSIDPYPKSTKIWKIYFVEM